MPLQVDTNVHLCAVFRGVSGIAVVGGVSSLAFIAYCLMYHMRRYQWTRLDGSPLEVRPPFVFMLDLSKLGAGQIIGWMVNLSNTNRNATLVHTSIHDPLSWYFPTFLADELFAVPLGVALGRGCCQLARHLRDIHGLDRCDALSRFGRYQPDSSPSTRPRLWWWFAQLVVWALCVAVSRYIGGLALPALETFLGDASPFHQLADGIAHLGWTCPTKRLVFAGLLRLMLDLLEIAVVDFFNKYVRGYLVWKDETVPLVSVHKLPAYC